MVTVPAIVWRGGSVLRALTIGVGFGAALGALAWIDSGLFLGFVVAFVLGGAIYGVLMSRRMARYWPDSFRLPGAERVALVRAARHGEMSSNPSWAAPTISYSEGLHAAVVKLPVQWLVWLIVLVFAGSAAYDAVQGSIGNGIASFVYLAAVVVELFWWPKREAQLLANCDRAADHARGVLDRSAAG